MLKFRFDQRISQSNTRSSVCRHLSKMPIAYPTVAFHDLITLLQNAHLTKHFCVKIAHSQTENYFVRYIFISLTLNFIDFFHVEQL